MLLSVSFVVFHTSVVDSNAETCHSSFIVSSSQADSIHTRHDQPTHKFVYGIDGTRRSITLQS